MYILMSFAMTILRLQGCIIRYLPFSQIISKKEKRNLFVWTSVLLILEFSFLCYTFYTHGNNLYRFKFFLLIGALPYIAIAMYAIKNRISQHIFIVGIQSIYTYFLHTIAALILVNFFKNQPHDHLLLTQSAIYTLLFCISIFPVSNILKKIFTSYHLVNDKYYWNVICLLPLLLFFSNTLLIVNNDWINSWQQILSRFLLCCASFIVCKSIILDLQTLQSTFQLNNEKKILNLQVDSLKQQSTLLENTHKEINIMRHDMRHNLQLLNSFLLENNIKEALNLISSLNNNLEQNKVTKFCNNSIINATLSVYLKKAVNNNIVLNHNLKLPSTLNINENDFAILLANLLENAINASLLQPINDRSINIVVNFSNDQICLVIDNKFNETINFDDNNFPITLKTGHGLGMESLKSFTKKYKASVVFTHQEGLFQVCLCFINKF